MFRITKEWLNAHKTAKGAWTKEQMSALGIKWPPQGGWKLQVCGTLIQDSDKERFEAGSNQYSNRVMSLFTIKVALNHMSKDELLEICGCVNSLLNRIENSKSIN